MKEMVPIFQPVFFGFGWKGLQVAGAPPGGICPVLSLSGRTLWCSPRHLPGGRGWLGVRAPGSGRWEEVHKWDAYSQPTEIHYHPTQITVPGRTLNGSISSGARPDISANISSNGLRISGETPRSKLWRMASQLMRIQGKRAARQAGGRGTKPGPTCALGHDGRFLGCGQFMAMGVAPRRTGTIGVFPRPGCGLAGGAGF